MPIINSLLDTDYYKLTQGQFVFYNYPDVQVEYTFNNRDKTMKFNDEALSVIKQEIKHLCSLKLNDDEFQWLQKQKVFRHEFLEYFKNFQFKEDEIDIKLDSENNLVITITGSWKTTIYLEVPLMAIISEVYFKHVDKDWIYNEEQQIMLANEKAFKLDEAGCKWMDFGTRRRRVSTIQNIIVREMRYYTNFIGTSNPYLAMKYGTKVLGSIAHEAVQAISELESINHPNKVMLNKWLDFYQGDFNIFLPDTYGLDSFFKDFDLTLAHHYAGLRHDSGCPFDFTDKVIAHYNKLGIDPLTKIIIFSDSLNVDKAIELKKYCEGKINCSFGIGTHFSNDAAKYNGEKSKPMNIVIKLSKVNGNNVCKLSCNPEKAIGHKDIVKIMRHIHFGDAI